MAGQIGNETMKNAWTWEVAYNVTRKMYMVWSNASPAIAFCYVEADADRIARLLNEHPDH